MTHSPRGAVFAKTAPALDVRAVYATPGMCAAR